MNRDILPISEEDDDAVNALVNRRTAGRRSRRLSSAHDVLTEAAIIIGGLALAVLFSAWLVCR